MATRLGNDSAYTDYQGLEDSRARPNAYIRAEDLQAVAADQAIIYQMLAGVDLAGGAYAGTVHRHDGVTGVPLQQPLSSWSIGESLYTAEQTEVETWQRPWLDWQVLRTAGVTSRVIYRWPVRIPPGLTDIKFVCPPSPALADGSLLIRLMDTSGSYGGQVARHRATRDGDYTSVLTMTVPAADTTYVMSLETSSTYRPYPSNIDVPSTMIVLPDGRADITRTRFLTRPDVSPVPLRGTSFVPIWDTWAAVDEGLSCLLLGSLADNAGYLHELLCAESQTGRSSAATTGHTHNTSSTLTDCCLASVALGCVPRTSADAVGLVIGTEADYVSAPFVNNADGTTSTMLMRTQMRTPDWGSTQTIHWGAMVYSDGHTCTVKAGVHTSVPSEPMSLGAYDDAQTTAGSGWQYVTGTISCYSNQIVHVGVEIAQVTPTASEAHTLTGVCFWMEA